MATIRDTDLLYVQRGETPHNWTGLELKALVTGTPSDGTLTVGQYLTPFQGTFNGTTDIIINVDGTPVATPSKVVVRDTEGSFAGNVITATSFVGDGGSLTNTGATLSAATGSQRVVVSSLTNGVMTTAATDGDLYFDALTDTLHCPNFSGNVSSTTKLETARAINGTDFDGTADITTETWGTARNINSVSINGSTDYVLEPYVERDDDTNASRPVTFVDDSTAAYKRLNMDSGLTYNPSTNTLSTGTFLGSFSGNASSATNAGYATSAGNSDTCDGLHVHTGRNNVANQIVRSNASGYIDVGWINTTSGTHNNTVTKVYSTYANDDYLRYCTPNHLANSMTNVVKTSYNTSLNSDTRNSRGTTRLYRRDGDSDYSIQTNWTGSRWQIYGYNGDSGHAGCEVAYATSAGSASNASYATSAGSASNASASTNASYATNSGYATSAGSASNASASSTVTISYNNNSNSTYQMLWGSGNSVYATGGVYCNPNANYVYASLFVGGLSGNASSATNASAATNAGYATSAGSASNASAATNASYATNAGAATNVTNAVKRSNQWVSAGPWAYSYAIPGGYATLQATNSLYNQGGGRVRCSVQFFADGGFGRMASKNIPGTNIVNGVDGVGVQVSSRQTKKDIIPLDGTTSSRRTIADTFETKFDQIEFVRYSYDLDHPINEDYGEHTPLLGVISEDLKDINPDWVVEVPNITHDPDSESDMVKWPDITEPIYALNQSNLLMSTMLALKIARTKIQSLESRIAALENA